MVSHMHAESWPSTLCTSSHLRGCTLVSEGFNVTTAISRCNAVLIITCGAVPMCLRSSYGIHSNASSAV